MQPQTSPHQMPFSIIFLIFTIALHAPYRIFMSSPLLHLHSPTLSPSRVLSVPRLSLPTTLVGYTVNSLTGTSPSTGLAVP